MNRLITNNMKTILTGILLIAAGIFIAPHMAFAAPSVSFSASPSTVQVGTHTALIWTATEADYCILSGGSNGWYKPIDSVTVLPQANTEYAISCVGPNGATSARLSVSVNGNTLTIGSNQIIQTNNNNIYTNTYTQPTVQLVANPTVIGQGEPVVLVWSSSNANYCYASNGWSGTYNPSGSVVVRPTVDTTYTITCTNNGNSTSDFKTVLVRNVTNTVNSPLSVACVTSPSTAGINERVTFAAGSSGGTGTVTYQWGGEVTGSGISQATSFSTLGTKSAVLTGTDTTGRQAQSTCNVRITNQTPIQTTNVITASVKRTTLDDTCLANGYVKKTVANLAVNNLDSIDSQNSFGFASLISGSMPPGLGLFLTLALILIIYAYIRLRNDHKKLIAQNGNTQKPIV